MPDGMEWGTRSSNACGCIDSDQYAGSFTSDDGGKPSLRFLTSEKLGQHQELTPEGFLLVKDAPIARAGTMLYAQGEVPVEAGADGIIRIYRDPEDVFSPMSIDSFNGKPVTNDHPPAKIDTITWRDYTVGVVINPRRGDGAILDNDFLYADLLIQDADAIRDVREGKRELSAGYDAEYEQLSPGEGRQHLIVGNHVALVDKGRCGPRCFIGDQDMAGSQRMVSFDAIRKIYRDNIMRAARANDVKTVDELVSELQRITGMLGDVLSGANQEGGFAKMDVPVEPQVTRDESGMHIHLHNGGSGMGLGRDDEEVGAGGGEAPSFGGEEPKGGGDLQGILERLEAVERAIAILAQQEGGDDMGEEPDPGREPGGNDRRTVDRNRRRTRDQHEPTEPDTDMPDDTPREDTGGPTEEGSLTGDRRKATVGDSTSLRAPWQELLSRAEVLAPGVRLPTFDAKASAKATTDAMCQFRRKVLGEAMKEDDTRQVVEGISGGRPDLRQMTCDAVTMLFNGSSTAMQQTNTKRATAHVQDGVNYNGMPGNSALQGTIADINRKNREKYGLPH